MRNAVPNISAVIIARNEQVTIRKCIESVLAQTVFVTEIIVVDGNSTDRTQPIVNRMASADARVRLLVEDPDAADRGPAAARNTGASIATGDLLLFLNGDVSVSPDYVSSLLAEMENAELDAVAGLRWNVRKSLIGGLMNVHYALNYNTSNRLRRSEEPGHTGPAFLSGDALLIRAESFWGVGGYDPTMPAGEDADLGYRLRGVGNKIGYCPDAIIWHEGQHYRSFVDWIKQIEWYGRGAAALARAHSWRLDKERSGLQSNVLLPLSAVLMFLLILVTAASASSSILWLIAGVGSLAVAARYVRTAMRVQQKCDSVSLPTTPLPVDILMYPLFKMARYGLLSVFTWRALLASNENERPEEAGDRTL
jgi:GT2 family glycosyltransferase